MPSPTDEPPAPNNTTLDYGYSENGKLAAVTDIHGRVMSFGYNAAGKLGSVTPMAWVR